MLVSGRRGKKKKKKTWSYHKYRQHRHPQTSEKEKILVSLKCDEGRGGGKENNPDHPNLISGFSVCDFNCIW